MSSDNVRLLRTLISDESQVPNDAIHLFSSNQDTDREKLNSIPTDQFNSEAIDSVKSAQLSSEQRNRSLEQARALKQSETQGFCTSLILKATTKYIMMDTSDGLVNGATGVLREIDNILCIQFVDESVGVSARSKCSHRQEPSWTPVSTSTIRYPLLS